MQRYFDVVQDSQGNAVQYANVSVYQAGTSSLAVIYATNGSGTAPAQVSNPVQTDALGNYGFAAPDGRYDIVISGGGIPARILPNICLFDNTVTYPSPMLGTVTSVNLSMPSVFTVSGGPVTGSGSFSVTLNSQSANTVLAGPSSGSSTTPSFRALVAADLPTTGTAGTYGSASLIPIVTTDAYGRVSGVTTVAPTPTWANVTGKPTTISGYGITDAASINVANSWTKAQNTAAVALASSGSITPDATASNVFTCTLTGNITLNNPTGLGSGSLLIFHFTQDAVGSRLISFGSYYKFAGGVTPALSTGSGAKDTLTCAWDGTILRCSLAKGFA